MFKLPENKLIEMLYTDGHHEEENVTIDSWYQIPESIEVYGYHHNKG